MNLRGSASQKTIEAPKMYSSATSSYKAQNIKPKEDSRKQSRRNIEKPTAAPKPQATSTRHLTVSATLQYPASSRLQPSTNSTQPMQSIFSGAMQVTMPPPRSLAPIQIHSTARRDPKFPGSSARDDVRQTFTSFNHDRRFGATQQSSVQSASSSRKIGGVRSVSTSKLNETTFEQRFYPSETARSTVFAESQQTFTAASTNHLPAQASTPITNVYNISQPIAQLPISSSYQAEALLAPRESSTPTRAVVHSKPQHNSMYKSQVILSSSQASAEQEVARLNEFIADLSKVNSELSQENSILKSRSTSAEQEVSITKDRLKSLAAELEAAKQSDSKLQEKTEECLRFAGQVESLMKQIELYVEKNRILENQIQTYTHETSSVLSFNGGAVTDPNNQTRIVPLDQFLELESDHIELTKDYDKLKQENLLLLEKLKSVRQESAANESIRKELEEARGELVILSKYVISQKNSTQSQAIIGQLQARLGTYSKNLESLIGINEKLKEELERAKEKERSSAKTAERSEEKSSPARNVELRASSERSTTTKNLDSESFRHLSKAEGSDLKKQIEIMDRLQAMIASEERTSVDLEAKFYQFDQISTNRRRIRELGELLEKKQAYNKEILTSIASKNNISHISSVSMNKSSGPNLRDSLLTFDDLDPKPSNPSDLRPPKNNQLLREEVDALDAGGFEVFDEKVRWFKELQRSKHFAPKPEPEAKAGHSARVLGSSESPAERPADKKHQKSESKSCHQSAKNSLEASQPDNDCHV